MFKSLPVFPTKSQFPEEPKECFLGFFLNKSMICKM